MNFNDPMIWASAGIILIGLVFLIWAIGRLRTRKVTDDDDLLDPLSASPDTALSPIDLGVPPSDKPARRDDYFATPAVALPSSVLTPTFSKEVSDRLESMTQRLAEMQAVLAKQTGGIASPAAVPGGIGQGMSAETIDKLLKIIGSVVQQVDVLQKSLNLSKEPSFTSIPASKTAAPVSSPTFPPLKS